MKLVFQHDRVVATALDDYTAQGWEQAVVDAPVGFDDSLLELYRLVDGAAVFQAADANVARAKQELLDTDWCENASVRTTENTPHLVNAAEYDAYRLALRAIVVSKPADVPEWPAKPDSVWST